MTRGTGPPLRSKSKEHDVCIKMAIIGAHLHLGRRPLSPGKRMRTVLIVLSAMSLTAPTLPLAGLWGTTTSNAVRFAVAAQQTSPVSDLEEVVGRGGGDSESGSASAGHDDADHEAKAMTPDITTPSDTSTDMTDNDATTASTASATSASSQSSVQESGTVGLFQQLQEKFQQMMTPQHQQTQTDSNQKQMMANAQKLQEEQLRKQQQRWSRGVTNPSINVGPDMPRKSRRRVLYEVSVRSHYADRTESGNNDNGEITSNSSDEGPRPRIDTRKTVAALILGGRGEVVWETGVDSARISSDDSDGKRGPLPARKMEGCAYFSTVPSGKKNTKQKMLPYWNYRICPGRSVEQFHVNLRRDMTCEELSEVILEGEAPNNQQQDGATYSGTEEEIPSTCEDSNGATVQYISLGKYIPPTISPTSSILSDEYHQYAKLWKDDATSAKISDRDGVDEGRGRVMKVSLSSYDHTDDMGEVSYYAGGVQCGEKTNPSERITRLVTLEGCCPKSDALPPPIFHDARSNLRIMSVAEPRMCRYNMLACFECSTNGEEKEADEDATVTSRNEQAVRSEDASSQKKGTAISTNFDIDQNKRSTSCDGSCFEATECHLRRMPSESSGLDKPPFQQSHPSDAASAFSPFPPSKSETNLGILRQMFQRSYDSYMYNAYPAGELKPITCSPGTFDLIRLPALTLIDSLDTMVIMRNFTEFARSVERLRALDDMMQEEFSRVFPNFIEPLGLPERNGGIFGVNQNVSLFETNIRVLGGLLSAHQLAEAFISEGVVAARDVWDESGNIAMGSTESSDQTDSSANNGSDLNSDASCPTGDPSLSPSPPCSSVDNVQDIGKKCKTVSKRENATSRTGKKPSPGGAADPSLSTQSWKYDGLLLTLAHDLGTRLLTAFATETGIPYGTVNLLYGIPPGETSVASLAGGGTLSIEMELLSRLTGDERFGTAARLATRALWGRRSHDLDLLGKHIDVHSGQWKESLSGIGSNSDSFYEYLIKHHILFPDDKDYYDLWTMFRSSYSGVFYENRLGDWYGDADMAGGRQGGTRQVFESLMAFWPGMQVLLGELNPAARSTNAFTLVREFLGLLPERFNFGNWKVDGGGGASPLRPELLESIYFLHMATLGLNANGHNDNNSATDQSTSTGWQWAADFALSTLEQWTRTDCPAHASVKAVDHRTTGSVMVNFLQSSNNRLLDEKTGSNQAHLSDDMPSYFLSETIKYLYLTFEGNENVLNQDHQREWVFTTEAHPLHHVPLPIQKKDTFGSQPTEDDDSMGPEDDENNDGDILDAKQKVLDLLVKKLASFSGENSKETAETLLAADLKPQHIEEKKLDEVGNKWTTLTSFAAFNQVISTVNNIIANNREALHQQGASQNTSIWTFDHEHHLTPHAVAHSSFWPNSALVDEAVVDGELSVENLSTLTTYRFGRGDGSTLCQTCPNLHNPDLRWVSALNGESLDYGESFVTFMSDVMTSSADMDARSALALSSAASYGTEHSLAATSLSSRSSCRANKPQPTEDVETKGETDVSAEDSRNEQIQELGLEVSRFDMGAPLGQFDVAVLTETIGFYVNHVASSNSIEATIFDDPAGGPIGVMVVADVPPPKPLHKKADHFPSIQAGRRCHWNAHLSRRDKVVVPANLDSDSVDEADKHKALPYQRRKTLFASSGNKMAFRCTVDLVETPSNETTAAETRTTVAIFPCSPALFGPTNITTLAESSGLTFEGSLSPPEADDESGCKTPLITSLGDSKQPGGEATSVDSTIQLVRRGQCRFQTKIANQVRKGLGRNGVIVINSDPSIFVMSSGCLQGEISCKEEDAEGSRIPSVMVGQVDAERMMSLAEDANRRGGALRAIVSLLPQQPSGTQQKEGSPLSNTAATTAELPIVSMSSTTVQIYAPGGWGIHAVKRIVDIDGAHQNQQGKEETDTDSAGDNEGDKDEQHEDDTNDNGDNGNSQESQKSEWQLFILQHGNQS